MKINWFKIKWATVNSWIENALLYGTSFKLAYALIYLKQGVKCKDCKRQFYYCYCNYCNNCEENYCLCNLILNNKDSEENRMKIRKFIINLILKILSKNEISKFIDSFEYIKTKNELAIENHVTKNEINFLNQIPKYLKQL